MNQSGGTFANLNWFSCSLCYILMGNVIGLPEKGSLVQSQDHIHRHLLKINMKKNNCHPSRYKGQMANDFHLKSSH